MRNRCFLLLPIALLVLLVVATAYGDPKAKAISMDSISADASMKLAEKMGYPKKANSAKKRPTKSPTAAGATAPDELASSNGTDVAGDFKHLAGDDLEFIAALEKQFSLYGGKVKIKVERDNSTDSKNPKRTVDGELGYGYSHNGYDYRKPTFMFYPYSQKNIPSDAPGYYPSHESSVSVQPSYSYELQPQTYEVPHQPQADLPAVGGHSYQGGSDASEEHQHPQQQHQQYDANLYEEPVIVLRIPGPPKYAAHLQALLQQYLQVRATQYLHLLENSAPKDEYHGQEQLLQEGYQGEHAASPQQQQQYAAQQYEDATSSSPHQTHDEHHYAAAPHFEHAAPSSSPLLQQQQHFDYQHQEPLSLHHSPSSPAYPNIDDVYQGYKDRHRQQLVDQHHQHELSSHVHSEPEYCPETDYHVSNSPAAPGPPHYYFPPAQHHYEPPTGQLSTGIGHSYQASPMFLYPMANPIYESPEGDAHLPPHHSIYEPERHLHEYEQQLHTSENNPRPTHTQIRYTPHSGKENAHEAMYTLPSIRPYERHPAAPMSNKAYGYLQQRQQQQQQQQQEPQQQQQQQPQQHIQQQHLESSAGTSAEGSPDGHQHQQQQQQQGYDDAASSANSGGEHREVAITQRPHNYHAHPGRGRRRSNNNNSKRDSSKAFEANNFGAKLVKTKNNTEAQ